jgi:heme oxygenase (staphylobilin-producing)
MYVVMNRIDVGPERAEMFEQHFSGSMDGTLAGVPGLLRSTLLRPVRDEDPYVAEMVFDSKESFVGWLNSDAFQAAHGHGPGGGEGGGPNVEAYEVVNEVVPSA